MNISYKFNQLFLALFVGGILFTAGCKDEADPIDPVPDVKYVKDFDHEIIVAWDELFLEVERYAAGYRPGPAPRALAHIGIANYEGCIGGMPEYRSIASLYGIDVPKADASLTYHYPSVINSSYAYLMARFFPLASEELKNKIANLRAFYEEKYKAEAGNEVYDRSAQFGEAVAAKVWAHSQTDPIGHDHYLDPFQGYDWTAHYTKDGDWKPTFPGPGKPMGGIWGGARTFAITQADKICRPPLPYSANTTSDLYSQALEVYAQNTPTLSYEDEWVGEFWSDDLVNLTFSPGPRWLAVGDQVLELENSNLETAVFFSVKMGMALNDASVGCWYSKFYYNVERPQTYINRVIDPTWKPALYNPLTGDQGVTPSFPAYPSGHSTMGAAGAEVLGSIFGYAYGMTDNCHANRTEFEGKPRTFGSFFEMAQENAWSRVPLGVHFRMDCEEGVRYGTVIGRKVNDLPWKK